MQAYLTPEETAQLLKVELKEILLLIETGKIRAIRIGESIRIPETELGRLPVTCPAAPPATATADSPAKDAPQDVRTCLTRNGTPFRVSGSVATGAEIWPGKMRYPIRFPKWFMDALIVRFSQGEVAVGGSFDGPSKGSLGEFIQMKLRTKMNPAVYVAALLIEEGYADAPRRGYIRFRSKATPWKRS